MSSVEFSQIQKHFERIGANLVLWVPRSRRWRWPQSANGAPSFDVQTQQGREQFVLRCDPEQYRAIQVLDVQPKDRHLLLQVISDPGKDASKVKLLCGHDERHWFVAGVRSTASTVMAAKEALKPEAVVEAQKRTKVNTRTRHKRHQKAYIRQGEWFFLPAPDVVVNERLILKNEPVQRGRSKPHRCEELYRVGGETVMVCARHSNGVTMKQYQKILASTPEAAKWNWRQMARNPTVYVRGKVTHPDHATIRLQGWHRVIGNTEVGSRTVAFLD